MSWVGSDACKYLKASNEWQSDLFAWVRLHSWERQVMFMKEWRNE